jgi:hypothetical protein
MTPAEHARRRAHSAAVEALLEELEGARREVYRSKVNGVRGPALRNVKASFAATQHRLVAQLD